MRACVRAIEADTRAEIVVAAWQAMQAFAGLRGLVVPRARVRGAATEAARSAFQELGVRGTRERNGVLVWVSPAEKTVIALCDDGLSAVLTAEDITALEHCLDEASTLDSLLSALERIGERLGGDHPRGDKTDNELEEVA